MKMASIMKEASEIAVLSAREAPPDAVRAARRCDFDCD
jgi:hypothetical protein